MKKFVKVPIEEYIMLVNSDTELNYLEQAGVDNWDPGYSREEYMINNEIDEFEITEEDITLEIIEEL